MSRNSHDDLSEIHRTGVLIRINRSYHHNSVRYKAHILTTSSTGTMTSHKGFTFRVFSRSPRITGIRAELEALHGVTQWSTTKAPKYARQPF